jgi:leucyl-tRNA synthetase
MFRAAVIILLLAAWTSPVQSQQPSLLCKPHAYILKVLKEKYGEHVMARAVNDKGELVEIFRNPKTKTWTVIVTIANNLSCVVGSGAKMEVPTIDDNICVSAVNEI